MLRVMANTLSFMWAETYICFMELSTGKTIHEGRNVKRFREMLGIKQESLAAALGEDWNQKKISLLEAKDKIEAGILQDVAKALKVPVEAYRILMKTRQLILFPIHSMISPTVIIIIQLSILIQ